MDHDTTKNLVREDGIIENMQAILYLFGAGLWGMALFMSLKVKESEKKRRIFYVLFLVLFLFFFFEEISWGQRFFGFSTPESLREVNIQDETNIHNIGILNSGIWFYILMTIFLLGILFPFLKLGSKKVTEFFERIKFPVIHHDLIACFGISLSFYSYQGFFWEIPLRIIVYILPIILILSGKLRYIFDNFKYPLIQFFAVLIIGFLVIAININLDTADYLSDNIAFEIRELLIAMALFFFSAYEAYGAWKRKKDVATQDIQS
ncbi:MAG: hypothetical protein JSV56_13305, partial [Methanomassiliicoccales archaeon]